MQIIDAGIGSPAAFPGIAADAMVRVMLEMNRYVTTHGGDRASRGRV